MEKWKTEKTKRTYDVKITVLKTMDGRDIFGGKRYSKLTDLPPVCTILKEGQEFIVKKDDYREVPEGFCAGAYMAIYPFILNLRLGSDFWWMHEKDTTIACCPDGLRPVVLKLKKIQK